jgi:hypothetical protein
MAVIGKAPVLKNLKHEDFMYTALISGTVTQNDLGKAVTQDTTADNTFKLAGDGDPIHGFLVSYEDRTIEGVKVGTISPVGGHEFEVANGATVNRGDYLVGGGSGLVKALATTGVYSTANISGVSVAQLAGAQWKVTAKRTANSVDYVTAIKV